MQSVESIIETTMARLKTIVDVNTIVGEPIPAGNGVVVPVSKDEVLSNFINCLDFLPVRR